MTTRPRFRRPSIDECDRTELDHWCVTINGEECPVHGIQCPSCGAMNDEDQDHIIDMRKLRWTCRDCGHTRDIRPCSIELPEDP